MLLFFVYVISVYGSLVTVFTLFIPWVSLFCFSFSIVFPFNLSLFQITIVSVFYQRPYVMFCHICTICISKIKVLVII